MGLLKLKDVFNYPNGSAFPSWGVHNNSDCCTWKNVICDNNTTKPVIGLDLSFTRDSGMCFEDPDTPDWSLNASYFLPFQELQSLNLSGNCLTGVVGEIRLNKLRLISLRQNRLKETPNFERSILSKLEKLNLGFNRLTGGLPEYIGTSYFSQILVFLCQQFVWLISNRRRFMSADKSSKIGSQLQQVFRTCSFLPQQSDFS
ncbi:receptor-like protein kinase [Quillaja saponaria]|uniref:Receptor-like protein kinase n=1 Tax=Quillaja saponaria TaxID=32244 RepID=A0AAD7VK90_QUISA|nr:receptor-like protein kinase [Quillaja saponaria]